MATFVWLEEEIQTKEEWRSAAMECGGPFMIQDGIVVMLLLLVNSLDSISPIHVCSEICDSMQGLATVLSLEL